MAYTPATSVPTLSQIVFFQWAQKGNTKLPALASPINSTATTLQFTQPALDHTGAVISLAFIGGVRNPDTGYAENFLVPAGGLSFDGLTATGVVRGIRLEGLDWTTGDSSFADSFNEDSEVFCDISGILQALNFAGLTAQIGANIKFNGRPLFITSAASNAPQSVPVYATTVARDAALTIPANGDMCYVTADGVFYDYQGGAWTQRASGATPNASEAVAGKVELATNAEMRAGTSTGGSGARLVPPNDQLVSSSSGAGDQGKLVTLNASGQIPAGFINAPATSLYTAKGSLITSTAANAPSELTVGINGQILVADSSQAKGIKWATTPLSTGNFASGINTAHDGLTSDTQNIAHGLGKAPIKVRITAIQQTDGGDYTCQSFGVFDGTGQRCVFSTPNSNGGIVIPGNDTTHIISLRNTTNNHSITAALTVDATNLILTWVTATGGTSGGAIQILWEVEG